MSANEFGLGYERDSEHNNWFVLPRDVEWRRGLYGQAVFDHPAKMQLHIVKMCLEYYGRRGMTVLDPFGGTGTTALAATMGYPTTLIELEDNFFALLSSIRDKWIEDMKILPEYLTLMQGDSRIVMRGIPESSIDLIITSPPYANLQVGDEKTEFTGQLAAEKARMRKYGSGEANARNFGQFNTFTFNEQMRKIYVQVNRVLKPDGLYISVTKDQMRDNVRQLLGHDVMRTATESGLEYTGDWHKWKPPGGMLAGVMRAKGSALVEDEDIIVFKKGGV